MELIWEGVGEFDESRYGGSITTLDFNHDGIDDLVVGSYEWSSNLNQSGPDQGKIYVYYGGTQFDTIPDLTADGSCYDYTTRLGEHIINIGDVNGDGC